MKDNDQYTEHDEKHGLCVICGNRVRKSQRYVTAEEGYCHISCIENSTRARIQKAARRNEGILS